MWKTFSRKNIFRKYFFIFIARRFFFGNIFSLEKKIRSRNFSRKKIRSVRTARGGAFCFLACHAFRTPRENKNDRRLSAAVIHALYVASGEGVQNSNTIAYVSGALHRKSHKRPISIYVFPVCAKRRKYRCGQKQNRPCGRLC